MRSNPRQQLEHFEVNCRFSCSACSTLYTTCKILGTTISSLRSANQMDRQQLLLGHQQHFDQVLEQNSANYKFSELKNKTRQNKTKLIIGLIISAFCQFSSLTFSIIGKNNDMQRIFHEHISKPFVRFGSKRITTIDQESGRFKLYFLQIIYQVYGSRPGKAAIFIPYIFSKQAQAQKFKMSNMRVRKLFPLITDILPTFIMLIFHSCCKMGLEL